MALDNASSTASPLELRLASATATPIAELCPQIIDSATRSVRGVITVVWPYSLIKKSIGFNLAEPDFRLRRLKGQVRVNFDGACAKAIAAAGLGGGDEIILSLDGVEWLENDTPARIPGTSLEWQIKFSSRVLLQDIPAIEDSPDTRVLDVTPQRPKRRYDLDANGEFASPAFIKRARVSYGSLFEGDFIYDEEKSNKKGRRQSGFARHSNVWRYKSESRSPSPEPESEQDQASEPEPEPELHSRLEPKHELDLEPEPKLASHEAPERDAHLDSHEPELSTPAKPQMMDEGVQTLPMEMVSSPVIASKSVQVSYESHVAAGSEFEVAKEAITTTSVTNDLSYGLPPVIDPRLTADHDLPPAHEPAHHQHPHIAAASHHQSEPYLISSDAPSADDAGALEAPGQEEPAEGQEAQGAPVSFEQNIRTLVRDPDQPDRPDELVEDTKEEDGIPPIAGYDDPNVENPESESEVEADREEEGGDYDGRNYADVQDDEEGDDGEDLGEKEDPEDPDAQIYDEDEEHYEEEEAEAEAEADEEEEEEEERKLGLGGADGHEEYEGDGDGDYPLENAEYGEGEYEEEYSEEYDGSGGEGEYGEEYDENDGEGEYDEDEENEPGPMMRPPAQPSAPVFIDLISDSEDDEEAAAPAAVTRQEDSEEEEGEEYGEEEEEAEVDEEDEDEDEGESMREREDMGVQAEGDDDEEVSEEDASDSADTTSEPIPPPLPPQSEGSPEVAQTVVSEEVVSVEEIEEESSGADTLKSVAEAAFTVTVEEPEAEEEPAQSQEPPKVEEAVQDDGSDGDHAMTDAMTDAGSSGVPFEDQVDLIKAPHDHEDEDVAMTESPEATAAVHAMDEQLQAELEKQYQDEVSILEAEDERLEEAQTDGVGEENETDQLALDITQPIAIDFAVPSKARGDRPHLVLPETPALTQEHVDTLATQQVDEFAAAAAAAVNSAHVPKLAEVEAEAEANTVTATGEAEGEKSVAQTPPPLEAQPTAAASIEAADSAQEDSQQQAAPDGFAITVKSLRSRGHRRNLSTEKTEPAMEDPSTQLARASLAARRSNLAEASPPQTSKATRARTRSIQMSETPEPATAAAAAAAAGPQSPLATQSQHSEAGADSEEKSTMTALKLQLNKALRPRLPYLTALKSLRQNANRTVDVIGTAGPAQVVAVQILRPHIESLPVVREGDAVLLRGFAVTALRGRDFGLRSGDASSWAVFERDREDGLPQIKGPPVEVSPEEDAQANLLIRWYAALGAKAREKIALANQRMEEAGAASSAPSSQGA
ncbi:unnamed protein product [Parascedosporium putredinis]|uniref:Telomeric single stranded DNA binding POT1/Cdc13 domain-containing protein n=1 Tax=Parascedosporium putredinis TaxID=1442378 RepID=A0A9P1GUR0_9PEZI|nr:unnamed protein product [Parascedosporium putredinis]CAI7987440.1 unnamed protein product [Parascedosporium putredinis]